MPVLNTGVNMFDGNFVWDFTHTNGFIEKTSELYEVSCKLFTSKLLIKYLEKLL